MGSVKLNELSEFQISQVIRARVVLAQRGTDLYICGVL